MDKSRLFSLTIAGSPFLRENLTMTVILFLLTLWQASVRLEGILQTNVKNIHRFFLQNIWFYFTGNVYLFRHFCLAYWVLVHYWRSIFTSLRGKRELTSFRKFELLRTFLALYFWVDRAYFEEIKQLVSYLSCLCFVVIYLYRLAK